MATIDHLGIAVKSLASAKAFYEKLGLQVSPEEVVEAERVRLVMVPVERAGLSSWSQRPTIPLSPNFSQSVARDCTMFACGFPIYLRPWRSLSRTGCGLYQTK